MDRITGYIGAVLLICRLFPILQDQIQKKENANPYFLCLEGAASLCLGISAFHIRAYPFIIANTFSFINVIIIASISLYRKFMSPPLSH